MNMENLTLDEFATKLAEHCGDVSEIDGTLIRGASQIGNSNKQFRLMELKVRVSEIVREFYERKDRV